MNIVDSLACLHEKYGLFNHFKISDELWTPNLLKKLGEIEETKYLLDFYSQYFSAYRKQLGKTGLNNHLNDSMTGVSRAVDLPFLGSQTIEFGRARYFLVFEGSLANSQEPSMTVLSCLWATNDEKAKSKILDEHWSGRGKSSYEFIVKCLKMDTSLAKDCFVTDAVKFGDGNGKPDLKRNREFLLNEIKILNPDFVILLGTKAKSTYGKASKEVPWKLIQLPFPTKNYRSSKTVEVLEKEFDVLKGVWNS